jgi:hypothetical protein
MVSGKPYPSWVVGFDWASRIRCLACNYERLPATLAVLYFLAFVCLSLHWLVTLMAASPY